MILIAIAAGAVLFIPKYFEKKTVSTRVVTYNAVEVAYGGVSTTISGSVTSYRIETTLDYAAVSERTKEIGIRKAVGAKRKHIMMQFLCESCVLSVLGGFTGLLMSFIGIRIYNAVAGSAIEMNWSVALAAIAFCAVIGVLFGSYPAGKASKLQPIEALHAE